MARTARIAEAGLCDLVTLAITDFAGITRGR